VFSPAAIPLDIGVHDAGNDEPIVSAGVYVERLEIPIGFESSFAGIDGNGDATFLSADTDIVEYRVRAIGGGYLPSEPVDVNPDRSGGTVVSIGLVQDTDLESTNTLRITIDLVDSGSAPTGLFLLTDTVVLKQGGVDLGLTSMFGVGEMIFLGVPSGTIEISVVDTADFDFDPETVVLGTGVSKNVVMTAALIEPPPLTRAELPGQIVGLVVNTTSDPDTPLPLSNALLLSTQESSGITTYTRANGSGIFFSPNIVPGFGEVKAFSEDGAIRGTTKPVEVVTGDVYGDGGGEDTDLSVKLGGGLR
jgi:hypothetical protein